MTLSAPEDIDNPTDTDTVETDTDGSDAPHADVNGGDRELTVSVDDGEEMPVTDAVELNWTMITNPVDFGIAPLERVIAAEGYTSSLEERIEQLQEQNAELRDTIEDIVGSINTLHQDQFPGQEGLITVWWDSFE